MVAIQAQHVVKAVPDPILEAASDLFDGKVGLDRLEPGGERVRRDQLLLAGGILDRPLLLANEETAQGHAVARSVGQCDAQIVPAALVPEYVRVGPGQELQVTGLTDGLVDTIPSGTDAEHVAVVPAAAFEQVVASAARDGVVTALAEDVVVAHAANQDIGGLPAVQFTGLLQAVVERLLHAAGEQLFA